MTLHQMKLFLAVCDYGSLTEAAEMVHISQPSLSVTIRQLEDEFGVSLFSRYRKRLVLTETGKAFRAEVLKIVENTSRLENYMRDIGSASPKVHIGISAMYSLLFFPEFIIPFSREHSSVQVEMHELSGIDAVEQLLDSRINLAVVNHTAVNIDQINFYPLEQSCIVGCVRKDHPLAYKTNVTPDMLAGEKLIFSGEKSYTTRKILQELENSGTSASVFMYSHQFLLMLQAVTQFNAIGFFFEGLVTQYDNIAPFYLSTPYNYTHGIVCRKDATLLKSERDFLKFCEAHKSIASDAPSGAL